MTVAVFVFMLFGCAQPDSDSLPDDLISDDTPVTSSAADSQETPPAQPSAVAAATATPTVVEPTEYVLENARQFDLSAAAILGANPDINPELLAPNQVLILPALVGTNPPRSLSNPSPAAESLQPPTVASQPSQAPAAIAPTTAATPSRRPIALLKPAAKLPQRYFAPPAWMLGPIQGSSEDDKFINDILYYLDQYNIPITVFHFDSDRWETCANNAEFKWSDALLQRMRSHTPPIRALFWILPLITRGCGEYGVAASRGYFVRNQDGSPLITSGWQGTGSWIDFNNPQAVAYWHSLLDRIFSRAVGVMGGFYTDDIHADLPNGPAYSDAFVRDLLDYTRSKIPDGDVVMKSYGLNTPDNAFLSRYGHASYVNDLDSGFSGLREGIRRVLASSALLPAPFNEFTGYSFRTPDSETYIRRLHWGAFQPIMENDSLPKNGVPWDSQYSPQVLQAYQYYSTLHWELVPFFPHLRRNCLSEQLSHLPTTQRGSLFDCSGQGNLRPVRHGLYADHQCHPSCRSVDQLLERTGIACGSNDDPLSRPVRSRAYLHCEWRDHSNAGAGRLDRSRDDGIGWRVDGQRISERPLDLFVF